VLESVPEVVFMLVGATSASAKAAKPPAGVPPRAFRLVPRMPRYAAMRYLALADVAVSPRVSGLNLPLKVIDYLCAGKAIVATDHPAHRTVLDESRALLVAPGEKAIAAGIVELALDRDRAAGLARAARRYATEHFGLGEFDAQVSRILSAAFAGDDGGGPQRSMSATAVP
jgi:glycosyltransferase involved in cell wall biosynthesis